MPAVRKEDASRALALLEQYHGKLGRPQDAALCSAIERVIRIFRSNLFYALIDIQEYYEEILRDVVKSPEQMAQESINLAKKWERPSESDGHSSQQQDVSISS